MNKFNRNRWYAVIAHTTSSSGLGHNDRSAPAEIGWSALYLRFFDEASMAEIQIEIEAFERMQVDLRARFNGRWVLIHDGQLINTFDSFELAATDAVRRFGRGPFLIRQVGAQPDALPVSVVFAWPNAES